MDRLTCRCRALDGGRLGMSSHVSAWLAPTTTVTRASSELNRPHLTFAGPRRLVSIVERTFGGGRTSGPPLSSGPGVTRGLRAVVGVLLVMGVCWVSAAGALASGWTIGSVSPPALPNGHLSAVSCSSSKVCTAVGYFTDAANLQVPLAERWDGNGWKIQNTPNPIDGSRFPSSGVPCASPTRTCAPQDQLTDVSCTSSRPAPRLGISRTRYLFR